VIFTNVETLPAENFIIPIPHFTTIVKNHTTDSFLKNLYIMEKFLKALPKIVVDHA
jgi:hypothetical protein